MKRALRAVLGRLVRHRKLATLVTVPGVLLAVNVPPAVAFVSDYQHDKLINSAEYKAQYGKWDVIDLPSDLRVNAIHAALLPTGKLLIIAGSGNDQTQFDAGTFTSLVYDPATGQGRIVLTPDDMFCGGHAFLSDGNLLVAGGTQRYEILDGAVTKAAGQLVVKNENPDAGRDFPKGTEFVAPDSRKYLATNAFTVKPATKTQMGKRGNVTVTASETQGVGRVRGHRHRRRHRRPDAVHDHRPDRRRRGQRLRPRPEDDHGQAGLPGHRAGLRVRPLRRGVRAGGGHEPKALVPHADRPARRHRAHDLGARRQRRDPARPERDLRPEEQDLDRASGPVPLLPDLPRDLPDREGGDALLHRLQRRLRPRRPGPRPRLLEPRGQLVRARRRAARRRPDGDERLGLGRAGPGPEDDRGRGRRRRRVSADQQADRRHRPQEGPEGRVHTRPGPAGADPLPERRAAARRLAADRERLARLPRQGRERQPGREPLPPGHEHALGRRGPVRRPRLPLRGHPAAHRPGDDPRRQLAVQGRRGHQDRALRAAAGDLHAAVPVHGPQPTITTAPDTAALGSTITVASPEAGQIAKARLIRPSAATHATDVEQRSVALDVTTNPNGTLDLAIPEQPTLVPPGYYMLFLVDGAGTPSKAHWVHVT